MEAALSATATGYVARASFAQHRMWFMEQSVPGTDRYHVALAWRLSGALDVPRLQEALRRVCQRHDALRTSYREQDGELQQQVHGEMPLDFSCVDTAEQASPEEAAHGLLQRQLTHPFDLSTDAPLRACLVHLGPQRHLLQLVIHHIACDGWSVGLIVDEISALYAGRELPPPGFQYADYSDWEHDWLRGETMARGLQYWQRRLEGVSEAAELPTDHPRPAQGRHRAASVPVCLSAEQVTQLRQVTQSLGFTPFSALAAALMVELHRRSRQEDVCIGYPVANRSQTDLERVVGLFVNTQLLRVRLQPGLSLRGLMQAIGTALLDNHEHQHLPFEKVVEALAPARGGRSSPLFQVMLGYEKSGASGGALDLPGVEATALAVASHSAKFDLSFEVIDSGPRIAAVLEFNADLFDSDTIRGLGEQIVHTLATGLAAPDVPLAQLPRMPQAQRAAVLALGLGPDPVGMEPPCSLVDAFERQVRAAPQAPAVDGPMGPICYADLDERANRLAQGLMARGLTPGRRVAVLLDRGADYAVAVLAILKAGAAYVPLDPLYPAPRLALILQTAGAEAWITQRSLLDSLPRPTVPCVLVDEDRAFIDAQPREAPDVPRHAGAAACCIFTSGTTGQPKGTVIEQHSIFRLVRGQCYARLDPTTRFLFHSPMAFDASTLELWGPLLNGGTVVMAPPGRLGYAELAQAIGAGRVDTVFMTASLFEAFVEHELASLGPVRQFLSGGDRMPPHTVRRIQSAWPDCTVVNLYGPTECTTHVCCERVPSLHDDAPLPLGRPIAGAALHVLDESLELVAPGVAGELYIAGAGLARGYLGQPGLTAERFLPCPFGPAGGRMYRTGDLVRWRPDGRLAFLGRIDHQVKIRGFRIEPAEVTQVLMRCAGVREAAVLAREDQPGERRLVAYVCGDADLGAVKAEVAALLPEPMVPSAWVLLDALPLDPNGKLDRRALPAPPSSADARPLARVAPRTPLEHRLCGIWQQTLGVDEMGVDDNFFALGGHSLKLLSLREAMRRAFGIYLPLQALLSTPTVAGCAALLTNAPGLAFANDEAASDAAVPPVDSDGSAVELALTLARFWALEQVIGDTRYTVPHVLAVPAGRTEAQYRAAWQALCRLTPDLLTVFVNEAPELRLDRRAEATALWSSTVVGEGAAASEAIAAFLKPRFDLRKGLVRVLLVQSGETDLLVFAFHHALVDSVALIALVNAYFELLDDAPAAAVQSLAAAASLREYNHWRLSADRQVDPSMDTLAALIRQLDGRAMHFVAADRYDAPAASRSLHRTYALSPDFVRGLERRVAESACTPFVAFLEAFARAALAVLGLEHFVLSVPTSARMLDGRFLATPGYLNDTALLRWARDEPSADSLARGMETLFSPRPSFEHLLVRHLGRPLGELNPLANVMAIQPEMERLSTGAVQRGHADVTSRFIKEGGAPKRDVLMVLDLAGAQARLTLHVDPGRVDLALLDRTVAAMTGDAALMPPEP
ncbi:non-ribosomal peptide synthetase [Roseateles sp. BYS96W]|uniref:Amino acid adenylation domain-containing protein n=1 Tax=Pelomonas nitida TaxID=3299027 RepID=A0ABW7GCP2_9BURK